MGEVIYCDNCKWFDEVNDKEYCWAPRNMKKIQLHRKPDMRQRISESLPGDLNKNNDCNWYDRSYK